jgi:hypothetical protein
MNDIEKTVKDRCVLCGVSPVKPYRWDYKLQGSHVCYACIGKIKEKNGMIDCGCCDKGQDLSWTYDSLVGDFGWCYLDCTQEFTKVDYCPFCGIKLHAIVIEINICDSIDTGNAIKKFLFLIARIVRLF